MAGRAGRRRRSSSMRQRRSSRCGAARSASLPPTRWRSTATAPGRSWSATSSRSGCTQQIARSVSLSGERQAGTRSASLSGERSEETMSFVDESKTFGRTRLSFASEADVDEFVTTLERYERGELTPDQWRAFRLVRGTYGQRQAEDAQMLRVKIPQGVITSEQLEALADVGDRYSRGFGHITTRQNIQLHFVTLHDVEHAMHRLGDAGLTTREACGNSVRNITACPYAGTAADERFDVTPYAEALTRYLLRHPLSSTLPRKFKIGFEGCAGDHIFLGINDLGFKAVLGLDGGRGFRVTAG